MSDLEVLLTALDGAYAGLRKVCADEKVLNDRGTDMQQVSGNFMGLVEMIFGLKNVMSEVRHLRERMEVK